MPLFMGGGINTRPSVAEELQQPFGAALAQTALTVLRESPVDIYRKSDVLDDAAKGKRYTYSEASDIIAQSGLPIDVPARGLTQGEIDVLSDLKREEIYSQTVVANSGDMTFGRMMAHLAVGVVAMSGDPVQLGLAFTPVIGQARYASMLNNATKASRFATRAGVGAAEGFVGTAAIEPYVYSGMQRQQADYDMYDSLMNVGLGTVFSSAIRGFGGLAYDIATGYRPVDKAAVNVVTKLDNEIETVMVEQAKNSGMTKGQVDELVTSANRAMEQIINTSPETRAAILNAAVVQALSGRRLDVGELAALGVQSDYSVNVFNAININREARAALNEAFQPMIDRLKVDLDGRLPARDYIELKNKLEMLERDADIFEGERQIRALRNEKPTLKDLQDYRENVKALKEVRDTLAKHKVAEDAQREINNILERYSALNPDDVVNSARRMQQRLMSLPEFNQRAKAWRDAQTKSESKEFYSKEDSMKGDEAIKKMEIDFSGDGVSAAEAELNAVKQVFDDSYKNSEDGVPKEVSESADRIVKDTETEVAAMAEAVSCALRGGV